VRTSFDIERASLLPADGAPPPGAAAAVDWVMTALLFLFPALGGLLFGYDIGATSGALISMTDPALSGTDWYSLNAFTSGLVVSLSLFGALAGSGAALVYGDRLGRRRELLMASVLYGESRAAPRRATRERGRAPEQQQLAQCSAWRYACVRACVCACAPSGSPTNVQQTFFFFFA
jgi:MFS family permease